jgi:putative methyltransferase (TIGR04325 family)
MNPKIRKIVEELTPPIVYRFLLRVYLTARGQGWDILYGCYPTLADVPATSDGQNSDWYVQGAVKQVESLKLGISRRPRGDDAGQLVLPLIISQSLGGESTVTVLDFGGGALRGLTSILEHVPDPEGFRYILVETPTMCRAIGDPLAKMQKEKFGGTALIEAMSDIPSSLPHPLIVNARSSIQYIPDYEAVLSRLLALAPEIFILAHTPVTDAPTFAQAQRNLPHRTLARWVFNRGNLISEIEKRGYRLACIFDHEPATTYRKSIPMNDVSMVFRRLTPSNDGKSS